MMKSKRVNANAPTLERSPRFARLRTFVYKYKYIIAVTTLAIAVTIMAIAVTTLVIAVTTLAKAHAQMRSNTHE